MQSLGALPAVLALVLCTQVSYAYRAQTNPLGKVLQLMDSLAAKITKEGEAEAKAYKEFFAWCDDASRNKKFEIKSATAKKAKLEAAVSKSTADSEAATAKIEDLAASLATTATNLDNATAIRKAEASDFAASEAELGETIDTISRALSVIEREMAKKPAAFAQLTAASRGGLLDALNAIAEAASLPGADRRKLTALVQSRQGDDAGSEELGAPAGAVYDSHSNSIVDVLEDLKEKAEEELSSLRKAEVNAKHSYSMMKQSLEDQTTSDNKDMADEKASKAASQEAKAIASGDLAETEKDLSDANSALQMANENCMQTAADHEATVKAREEELKVIAEAKKILADSAGGAESQAYGLVQTSSGRAGSRFETRTDLRRAEVLTLVKRLAKEHHSAALAQLASRISAVLKLGSSAGEEPFAKVKGLISDLISKLEAQAGAEAEEKAYCDEQLAKTEAKKADLEGDMSKLTAKLDQAAARSASLKASVKQLQDELATLAKEQAEMDKIRQEEHAAFVEAKADLEAGLEGVRRALGVLRDYYGGAGAGAAMLQEGDSAAQGQPAMPAAHSKAAGAGSSIIGILEVVEADFAKSLATEETGEDGAQAEYEKTTHANSLTKTRKDQDVTYQTKEFRGLDKQISELTSDRETMDNELSAVLEYYAKIKERCIAKPETYEARKARREAEIKGLKEALSILQDETALFQRGRRGLVR